MREWAVFALRSLLDGNPENQRHMLGLNLQQVSEASNAELAMMGLRAFRDPVTGSVRIAQNVNSQDQAHDC